MAVDMMDDFELERLRAEIQQERQMKEMLDQSSAELKTTVGELDKRLDTIGDEGNEWKTRFETQEEMNQQLQRQILMLQTKVEEARKNLKDASRTPRDIKNFDDLSDANPQMVKALEKERNQLLNQLRDLEWRLDQESKVYHKANDERKQYVLEINSTKHNLSELRVQSKASGESARTNKNTTKCRRKYS
ncbi:coiled-coil domain-containing protein 169-like [Liolophura sinensis]|uniref:coiled-coil domain-containing protein 169-like n=1 Tax=Liolophura sinensis TaxID=3198878 RepID=UPI003158A17D